MQFPFGYDTIGFRKKSPYNKFFKKSILAMNENGELDLFIARNSLPPTQCDGIKSSIDILGWSKIAPLFLVFFLGIFFSFLVAIYEYFHRPQGIKSTTVGNIMHFEQNAKRLFPMVKRIINATENDKAYFSISDQYLAETEILLEQLNPNRTNKSTQDINTC